MRSRNCILDARWRSAISRLSQNVRPSVVPSRERNRAPSKPSVSESQRYISSATTVAFSIGWSPVLTVVRATYTSVSLAAALDGSSRTAAGYARGVATPVNVWDYEQLAEEKLDANAHAYFVGGSGDEVTLRENLAAFERCKLRPRVLVDVSSVSTATTVLGTQITLPILIAPLALQRMAHPTASSRLPVLRPPPARSCASRRRQPPAPPRSPLPRPRRRAGSRFTSSPSARRRKN